MNNRLLLAAFLVMVVSLSGYFYWLQTNAQTATGSNVGDKAISITLSGIEGSVFNLESNRGKMILLDFMTTTCPYCIEEFKELGKLTGINNLLIVSINLDRTSPTDLANFGSKNSITWFLGSSQKAGIDYKVNAVPTLLLIDKEGIIRYRGNYTPLDRLINLIDQYSK